MGRPDAEGYHPLASLVAFADVGDRVEMTRAPGLSLSVGGPFAPALDGNGDNLIVRALRAARAEGLAVRLDKQLPVAAGLGGGSADAGAALRLAGRLLGLEASALERAAAAVGADGPMCLASRSAWAEGRGDILTPEPRLPALAAVLANPGVASPTGAVYRRYDADPHGVVDRPPPDDWSPDAVIAWLARQRNDLEAPAIALNPAIGRALEAMANAPGAALARMSGSGATVFGLFRDMEGAVAAAAHLRARHGRWWIRSCVLGDPEA